MRFSPESGAVNVPRNRRVILGFDQAILATSVTSDTVRIESGGQPIAAVAIISADRRWVSLRPAGLLAPLALHTVFVDGVNFENGAAVPSTSAAFTTSSSTFYGGMWASLGNLSSAPVPINASMQILFEVEFDPTTVVESGFQIINDVTGQPVPVTLESSPDRNSILIQPLTLLAVGTQHRLRVEGVENFVGLTVNPTFSFVTGFSSDTVPPTLKRANPGNGAVGVGLFDDLLFEMSEPVLTPGTITVEKLPAGPVITGFAGMTWDNPAVIKFDAAAQFDPSSDYRVTVRGVRDFAGNEMAGEIQVVFRTGPGAPGNLRLVASNPETDSGVPTNVVIEALFERPIDPASLLGEVFTLEYDAEESNLPIELSQGGRGIRAIQHSPLKPDTQYRVVYPWRVTAINGDRGGGGGIGGFVTGSQPDTQAPSIVSVNPPPGAVSVPLQVAPAFQLDELPNRATLGPASVTLATTTGVQVPLQLQQSFPFDPLRADQRIIWFKVQGFLAPNTSYVFRVEGVEDVAGNRAPPVVSEFRTTPVGGDPAPQVLSMQPAPGSTGASLNPVIVLTLSQPLNPVWLSGAAIVDEELNVGLGAEATVDSSGTVLTLRPLFTLQPLRDYRVRLEVRSQSNKLIDDVEGLTRRFTTGTGPIDTARPRVVSMSPAHGSQDVHPSTPLVISFSEPVNPNTVNFENIGVWIDKERTSFGPLIFRSPDNTTFTFSGFTAFSPGTEVVVWISDLVTDLAGNRAVPAAARYAFRDTTFDSSNPELVSSRPANGSSSIPAGSPVTFFFSEPLRLETVEPNIRVAENGVLAPAKVSIGSRADYAIALPGRPFTPGSLAQGFADRGIRDIKGNFLHSGMQSTAFRISENTPESPPRVVDVFPSCCEPVAGNAIAGARFSKPLQQSSVNKASVIVNDLTAGRAVNAQVSLDAARQVITIEPPRSWPAGARIQVIFTGSIRAQDGGSLQSAVNMEFLAGETLDRDRPAVVAISPFDNASNVPVNALARIRFSEPVSPLTVNEATVKLSRRQGPDVPYYLQFSDSGRLVTLTPQSALPEGTEFTLAVNGVTDGAGNAATGASASFRTGRHVDAKRPERGYEPFYGERPINAGIPIFFNEPIDPTSAHSQNIKLWKRYPVSLPDPIPGSMEISADGMFATFRPNAPLPVYSQFTLEFYAITDLAGNELSSSSVGVETTASVDSSPPTVTPLYPLDGQTGVPLDALIRIELSELPANDSLSPERFSVTSGGNRVAGEILPDFNSPNTLQFRPFEFLAPGTRYTVEISGFKDLAGNEQKGAVRYRFTTGPAPVFKTSVDSLFPRPGSHGVPWDIQPHFHSKIPIDPATLSTAKVILQRGDQAGPPIGPPTPARLLLDNGDTRLRIVAESLLAPLQYYRITLTGELFDVLGHQLQLSEWWEFRTSADYPDNDPPVVTRMTPPDGAVAVPITARVTFVLNEVIDPDTLTPTSVTLRASTGEVVETSLEFFDVFGGAYVRVNYDGPLQTNTRYTVSVKGLADFSGNAMDPFIWVFQTATTSVPDVTPPSLVSVDPPLGATALPLRPVITLTFNEPLDSASVILRVTTLWLWNHMPEVRYVVNGNALRIEVAEDLLPNQTYQFAPPGVSDLVGNVRELYPQVSGTYATGPGPGTDQTPPTVIKISPPDGAESVPPFTSTVITFSEPISHLTAVDSSFALVVGGVRIPTNVSRSPDNTVITVSPNWGGDAFGEIVETLVTSDVTDFAGNPIEPFSASYRVAEAPATEAQSQFHAIRPESGATGVRPNNPVTLFFSDPINRSTAAAGVQLAVNGVLTSAEFSFSAGNRVIEIRPRNPFPSGALVETFVGPELVDESGFPVFPYRSAFYFFVAAGTNEQPTRITGLWPNESTNPVTSEFTVAFNNPIDPATVTTATINLRRGTVAIDGTLAVAPNGRIITFRPAAPLPLNSRVFLFVGKGLRDSKGTAFLRFDQSFGFNIGSVSDTAPPMAIRFTPPPGSPGVGVNASIQIDFNEVINTAWLNESSVTVASGAGVLSEYSLRLDARSLMITSNSSLRENSVYKVSVGGVRDNSGNVSAPVQFQFTTGSGVDFIAPHVVQVFPAGAGVTRNAAIRVTFTEPVFPPSVNSQTIWVENQANGQRVPGTVALDSLGRTAIFSPSQPFDANTTHLMVVDFGIVDLSGNRYPGQNRYWFSTTSSVDTQPPLIRVAPVHASQDVPRNIQIAVWADSPLTPESFEPQHFELRNGQGTVVPVSLTVGADRSSVALRPNSVLDANTVYSVRIGGISDISGNGQPQPAQAMFQTGPGFDLQAPGVLSTDPPDGGSDVPLNPELRITFSEPVIPDTSAFSLDFPGIPIAVRFDESATTAIVTPLMALDPSRSYRLSFPVRDLAGNFLLSTPSIWFSTLP